MEPLLSDIIEDVELLIHRAAHVKRKTIQVSPEVAALLEQGPRVTIQEQAEAPHTPEVSVAAVQSLEELERIVAGCRKCGLCNTRKQTVFSDGTAQASVVFVGEAPGADEDRQGKPFVGRAGQLLTDIIEKGMGMYMPISRDDVYICNVIKCRPPENRDPLPEEKAMCMPYLVRQLELVKPKAIVALGRHAAQSLLQTDKSVSQLRGRWHAYQGIPLRVTFHPAYLLRNEADKKKCWEDIKHVTRLLRGEETASPA